VPRKLWIGILFSCLASAPTLGQTFQNGSLGLPSKGEIIAAVVGGAAIIGLVVYVAIPKQSRIEGCVASSDGGLSLDNDSDHHVYILVPGSISLQPGQRVVLKGKKGKKISHMREFNIRKLLKDEGSCTEHSELLLPTLGNTKRAYP
jgi:hypothetical protein